MIKLNQKALIIAALICGALGFAGCGSTPPATGGNTVVATNTNNEPKTGDVAKNDAPATGDKTGVAECDEYIEKYEICLTGIAEKYPQIQPSLKSAFETQRKGFKDAAANPQSKATLASTCKQAMDAAKQATTAYACKW